MSITKYVEFTQIICPKYRILFFEVSENYPTPLQWKFAMEDFKLNLDLLNGLNGQFALIIDLKKFSSIPSEFMDFINILISYSDLLESKLIGTSVINDGSIVSKLFGLIKLFYKTKKPLEFVFDMPKAIEFIDSNLS